MRSVTPLGWKWEWRYSLWMILAITPFTLPICYFYVGTRIMKTKWIFIGFIYYFINPVTIYIFWKHVTSEDLIVFAVPAVTLSYLNGVGRLKFLREDYLWARYEAMDEDTRVTLSVKEQQRLDAIRQRTLARYQEKYRLSRTEIKKRQSQKTSLVRTEKELNKPITVLNVNQSNVDELERIPGIGNIIAQKIVNKKHEVTEYRSFDHLVKTTGIKSQGFLQAKDYLAFKEEDISPMQAQLQLKHTQESRMLQGTPGRPVDY